MIFKMSDKTVERIGHLVRTAFWLCLLFGFPVLKLMGYVGVPWLAAFSPAILILTVIALFLMFMGVVLIAMLNS